MATTVRRLSGLPPHYAERVRKLADRVNECEAELAKARAELRALLLEAVNEGIPQSVLAQHAGITRERVRQLVSPRPPRTRKKQSAS